MAMAVIQGISEVHERAGAHSVVVNYILTEGDEEQGPVHITVATTPGTSLKQAIADAVEEHATRFFTRSIERYGSPVELGRKILFPDGSWDLL